MSDVARAHVTFSPRRVAAMVLRYWYLLRSSFARLIELIYWPAVQMLMWGFLQTYLAGQASLYAQAGGMLVGAVMLWDILFRGQLGFSISFLEEMYARNLGNLTIWFFGFNLWALGLALAAFFANLMLTGWAVGIFVSGLVLRNGLGAETFAWSIMFLFLPLTCVYYPVAVLPEWLQAIAWSLPPTYVFEGMRALLIDHTFRADLMIVAFALNMALFSLAVFAFLGLLASARRNGSLM